MAEEIVDMTGKKRKLGWVGPSPEHSRKMRAGRNSIRTLREAKGLPPVIPRNQWRAVDYVSGLINELINDQKSSSGCTGWSAAGALGRMRVMRGYPFLKLSGAAIYAQINGGRDDGSNIIDSMRTLENVGTCLEAEMNYPKIYQDQIPSGKLRYKEDVVVTLDDSDECATALQMGILPQVPIRVFNGWDKFNGDGVAKVSKGTTGNHSVYLAGLEFIGGNWMFRMVNSWGPRWGPFKDGTCRLTMAHIDNCDYEDDAYGHTSPLDPE